MKNLIKKQLKWIEPSLVAEKLSKTWGESGLIWLDGDGSILGRWIILAANPIDQICCHGLPNDHNSSNPFHALNHLPPGHWTGWLSYEAAAWLEPSNPWKKDSMATLWIANHDPILRFDLKRYELWIEGVDTNRIEQLEALFKDFSNESEADKDNGETIKYDYHVPLSSWEWLTTRDKYSQDVNSIKELIESGDIFQANLTAGCRTNFPSENSVLELFLRLRKYCPAPFSGLLIGSESAENQAILTVSPERFLQVKPTGEVETRPIKGTRPRHSDPLKDADLAADLISSLKDRAENIMIVDLLRNDLGRVCQAGSINVTQLVGLESFSQVHHLTSVIAGKLQPDKCWLDLLKACWPGGSITGAPKLRACKRLHELEPMARGPYCGSMIHIDWDGTFDSNILIRSLMREGSTLRANAGCGIVADSDPINESNELCWKLLPLLKALE